MHERKFIESRICTESFYDLLDNKTPDQIVIEFEKYTTEYYHGRDVFFRVKGYGYDGGVELELWEKRLETDKEYEKRVREEKKASEKKAKEATAKKDREYAEFLRLKKKFGE